MPLNYFFSPQTLLLCHFARQGTTHLYREISEIKKISKAPNKTKNETCWMLCVVDILNRNCVGLESPAKWKNKVIVVCSNTL